MKYKSKIIRLLPSGKKYRQLFSQEYYEDVLERSRKYFPDNTVEILREKDRELYDNYLELDIPIGASRIGGPVVDMPVDMNYPQGLYFAAQLDCMELKKHDELDLLPQKGFLYFFIKDSADEGVVLYSPADSRDLRRITKEHMEWYYSGQLIGNIHTEIEAIESRYTLEDGQLEWDFFAGTRMTKVYGLYTNCQANEEEFIEIVNDLKRKNMILLLQIGSDFSGSGTLSVYINKNDLKALDFTRCTFEYKQS